MTLIHLASPIYIFKVLIETLAQMANYYVGGNAYQGISVITRVNRVIVSTSKLVERTDGPLLGIGNQSATVGSTA